MNIITAAKLTRDSMGSDDNYQTGNDDATYQHIKWMLTSIISGYVQGEKAHRWLGWAQAIVCASGEMGLDELKELDE